MKLFSMLLAMVLLQGMAGAQKSAAPATTQEDARQLARLQKEQKVAKAAYGKKPADAAAKRRYVVATVRLGTATMTSLALPPRAKYPRALALYREALKVDPKNREARNNSQMIVNIYKQMGRPVPKG